MKDNRLVVGIDLGGTNTVLGLIDESGNIYHEQVKKTSLFETPDKFAKEIEQYLHSFKKEFPRIVGIGIGAPNGNFFSGTIEFAPNLPWSGIVPLAKMVEEKCKLPTRLTNDANAAAIGEMQFGSARNMKDFIFITLGTGVGSGIVVNGSVLYGHDGFAGEIGHTIIIREGRLCRCGRRGCLEAYCSAPGLVNTYKEYKGFHENQIQSANLTAHSIYLKAMDNEAEALKAFDFTADLLGLALANSVAYTSPSAIFLFGGLAQSGHLLFRPVEKYFDQYLLPIYRGKTRILPSGLSESNAALLGAASIIWNDIKTKES